MPIDPIVALRNRRAALKGSLTRTINQYEEAIQVAVTEVELISFSERFKRHLEKLLENSEAICDLLEDASELTSTLEKHDEEMTIIFLKQADAKVRKGSLCQPTSNVVETPVDPRVVPKVDQKRLATIKLPKFDGSIFNWTEFWGLFKVAVHDNPDLSNVEKFYYLKEHLVGRAANAVFDVSLQEEAYPTVIEELIEEFGAPELLKAHYMAELENLPHISSAVKVDELRFLYSIVNKNVVHLKALGMKTTSFGHFLFYKVKACLPPDLQTIYNRSCAQVPIMQEMDNDDVDTSGEDQLNSLLSFLKREIKARADITVKNDLQETSGSKKKDESNFRRTQSTAFLHYAGGTTRLLEDAALPGVLDGRKSCKFCRSLNHGTSNCDHQLSIQRKMEILMASNSSCFRCTGDNHNSRNCKLWKKLNCSHCNGRHAASMCEKRTDICNTVSSSVTQNVEGTNLNESSTHSGRKPIDISEEREDEINIKRGALLTAQVFAENEKSERRVRARVLIDGGATTNFITRELASALDLPVRGYLRLSISGFHSKRLPPRDYPIVEVFLRSLIGRQEVAIRAAVVSCITDYSSGSPWSRDVQHWCRLRGTDPADAHCEKSPQNISVLISSSSYYDVVLPEKPLEVSGTKLVAIRTKFGFVFQGVSESVTDNSVNLIGTFVGDPATDPNDEDPNDDESIKSLLQRFWSVEDIPTTASEGGSEEMHFVQKFQSGLKQDETGRYIAPVPLKSNMLVDSNRNTAYGQLLGLTRTLIKRNQLTEYHKEMLKYLSEGNAQELVDPRRVTKLVYYLHHHGVWKLKEGVPTLRVVFNASARSPNGYSLNDITHKGPHLVPDLLEVLLNYRRFRWAATADIERAYPQIKLDPVHRDLFRFLWYDNLETQEVKEYTMESVIFGGNASMFMLTAVIHAHLDRLLSVKDATFIKKSLYVDDFICSLECLPDLKGIHALVSDVFRSAGMTMRKWVFNHNESLVRWAKAEERQATSTVKVLGLQWNMEDDTLNTNIEPVIRKLENLEVVTKRIVLQISASFYDPLGLIGPYTVRFKILLQKLWAMKLDWDVPVPEDIREQFIGLISDIKTLDGIRIQRSIYLETGQRSELHIFGDASAVAYGTVAFVRTITPDNIRTAFLMSRNKVAPCKKLTIPQLELLAAKLAATLGFYLINHVSWKFDACYYWSDSMDVLYWINSRGRKLPCLVTNAVEFILQRSTVCQWRHCPGDSNPADILSRGASGKKLADSDLSKRGPCWLTCEKHWPSPEPCSDNAIDTPSGVLTTSVQTPLGPNFIDIQPFSCYSKFVRTVAFIKRFIDNCRSGHTRCQRTSLTLLAEELCSAKLSIWRLVQTEDYSSEIMLLRAGGQCSVDSKIRSLSPYLDESGILRSSGRLGESLDYERTVKNPLIVSGRNKVTQLYIMETHIQLKHSGVSQVMAQAHDEGVWIINARRSVKASILQCFRCHRFRAKSYNVPHAPLPMSRISQTEPFSCSGMDFLGPLVIHDSGADKKCYVALLTCQVTRAIHLEVTTNLSTESVLMALRRFVSRRGLIREIQTDNFRSFKSADKEIQMAIKSSEIQDWAALKNIKWSFITERAPWEGGYWERLVKLVKDILKRTLGRTSLSFEALLTIISECEAIINSRPLTYISNDPDEEAVLTPAHFLIGRRLTALPDAQTSERKSTSTLQRWEYRQKLMQNFWRRFHKEYLLQLRSGRYSQSTEVRVPVVGDLVLLMDQNTPRQRWPYGRIVEITGGGRDQYSRCALVKVASRKGEVLRRSIRMLCPLEPPPLPVGTTSALKGGSVK